MGFRTGEWTKSNSVRLANDIRLRSTGEGTNSNGVNVADDFRLRSIEEGSNGYAVSVANDVRLRSTGKETNCNGWLWLMRSDSGALERGPTAMV